jgi:hypothetical protein
VSDEDIQLTVAEPLRQLDKQSLFRRYEHASVETGLKKRVHGEKATRMEQDVSRRGRKTCAGLSRMV